MKRTILLVISVSILTVLATQLALGIPLRQVPSAQIPEIISYQGLLNDNNGTPLNGNYELTVRIYNQESAGSHLWEETHADAPVNNGLFNLLLGSANPLTVAFDEPYYMGLSINGEEELTPRLPFTSVGTAFVAKVAYRLAPDAGGNITLGGNVDVEGKIGATEYCDENGANCVTAANLVNPSSSIKVASEQDVIGPDSTSNQAVIDLSDYDFDANGSNPHIIVSERDFNVNRINGNTMDASYCGFEKLSKLEFKVTCWASPNNSSGVVQSSFDWLAIQN